MKFFSPNFLAMEYFHSVHSSIFATRWFFRGGRVGLFYAVKYFQSSFSHHLNLSENPNLPADWLTSGRISLPNTNVQMNIIASTCDWLKLVKAGPLACTLLQPCTRICATLAAPHRAAVSAGQSPSARRQSGADLSGLICLLLNTSGTCRVAQLQACLHHVQRRLCLLLNAFYIILYVIVVQSAFLFDCHIFDCTIFS